MPPCPRGAAGASGGPAPPPPACTHCPPFPPPSLPEAWREACPPPPGPWTRTGCAPHAWPADMQSRQDSHRAPPRRPVSLKIGPQIKSNQIAGGWGVQGGPPPFLLRCTAVPIHRWPPPHHPQAQTLFAARVPIRAVGVDSCTARPRQRAPGAQLRGRLHEPIPARLLPGTGCTPASRPRRSRTARSDRPRGPGAPPARLRARTLEKLRSGRDRERWGTEPSATTRGAGGGGGIFRVGENMNLQILARQHPCHFLKMSEQMMCGSQ